LSPLATYEGRIVSRNIVDDPSVTSDWSAAPSSAHRVPGTVGVGPTAAVASALEIKVSVKTHDMTGWFSGKTYSETVAFARRCSLSRHSLPR